MFKDPYSVSYNDEKEELKITFFMPEFFKDRKGAPVIGGPDGQVPHYLLPPQIPHIEIQVEEIAPAAAVVGDLG